MKTPHKHAEVIKAWADGHTVQWMRTSEFNNKNGWWRDISSACPFPDYVIQGLMSGCGSYTFRIKPEPLKRWYRVALLKNGRTYTSADDMPESRVEQCEQFLRWLTPRTEYEVD